MAFLSSGAATHLIATYGYFAVIGVVALEGMGIPAPGETILIAAAIVAGTTGALDIRLVIAAAAAGAILGDNTGFWIGRKFGYWLLLRYGSRVWLTERRIKLGQYLFLRHGGKVVFLARLVTLLRTLAAFLAGANRMAWGRFVAFNAAGATAWALVYGLSPYALGKAASRLAGPVGLGAGALGAALLIAAAVFLHRHAGRLEDEAETALPGPLRPLGKRRASP